MLDLDALDFDYADPFAPVFAPGEIVYTAVRFRRRRRVALLGTAMAGLLTVVAALTLPAWWSQLTQAADAGNRYGTNLTDPVADQHLASDPIVVLGTAYGWKAFVYYSLSGEICWGAIAVGAVGRGHLTAGCGKSVDTASAWVDQPSFLPVSDPTDHRTLVIGLVEGPATAVRFSYAGHPIDQPLVPVAVHGLTGLSAYAAWVPTEGARSFGSAGIAGVVATSASGRVVATARS